MTDLEAGGRGAASEPAAGAVERPDLGDRVVRWASDAAAEVRRDGLKPVVLGGYRDVAGDGDGRQGRCMVGDGRMGSGSNVFGQKPSVAEAGGPQTGEQNENESGWVVGARLAVLIS